jgi:hypothetical protein
LEIQGECLSRLFATERISLQLIHAINSRPATHGGKMTGSTGDDAFLHTLEAEVESELTMAESSRPEQAIGGPVDWLVDPAEAERDEVGLRSLLGAVEALEGDSHRAGVVRWPPPVG